MNRALWFALLASLCACASTHGPRPEDVPTSVDANAGSVPVLQVSLRATPAGYTLVQARRAIGTPTLAFDPDLPVVVTASGPGGARMFWISVPNPRTGHADRELVLQEGFLSLRLPDPDSIRSLDILVRSGPNAGLHQSFPIEL